MRWEPPAREWPSPQQNAGRLGLYLERQPEKIGNEYLVMGTVDRPVWLQGDHGVLAPQQMLDNLHGFNDHWCFEPGPRWAPE